MKTIYKLTRDLSGESELIYVSTDRKLLANTMREDIDKWTVPVTYTIEITFEFDNILQEGRISAFRQGAKFFDREADNYLVGSSSYIGFRRASLKLFAWMEQEIAK